MKKQFLVFVLGISMFSCSQSTKENEVSEKDIKDSGIVYQAGEKLDTLGAISTSQMMNSFQGDSMNVKLKAKINSCCQKKGCWMKVGMPEGEEMMVRFKDYGFFVPKDASGKWVIMDGVVYKDTVSVDMLKHYAEDAGQSQAEIESITEPEVKMAFEASGLALLTNSH